MTVSISRRGLLGRASAAALAAVLPLPALALTTDGARALVGKVVDDINRVINSGESESAMFDDFAGIFRRYADVATIAMSTLGPDARRASSAQRSTFVEAFIGYISRKYGKRFREFIGGKIVVNAAREFQSGRFEVKSTAILQGEAPFDVTFLVTHVGSKDLFYDMLIEGISLLRSERTEIGAMIDRNRGNLDAMIQDLRKAG